VFFRSVPSAALGQRADLGYSFDRVIIAW